MNSIVLRKRITVTISAGLILFFSGIILLVNFRIEEGLLLHQMNGIHNSLSDTFFRKITHLGDAPFYWLISLTVLGIGRVKTGIQLIIGGLFAFIFTGLLKHFINAPRPFTIYGPQNDYLHFIDGISFGGTDSFPSAHTVYAITLAMLLFIDEKRPFLKTLYVIAGLLVGFSRLFLGNHFPGDVLAGIGIGIIGATLSMQITRLFKVIDQSASGDFASFNQSESATLPSTN